MPHREEILAGLNPAQRDAALDTQNHCVVLSCPGSGKTKTVEAKVVHILSENPDSRIICTTFSKAGAQEMQDRIYSKLSDRSHRSRLIVSTFHSLCYQALKSHNSAPPRIISPAERMFHLKGAAFDIGLNIKSPDFQNALESLDSYATHNESRLKSLPESAHKLYERYKERLKNIGKMDFEDLVIDTVNFIENGIIMPEPCTHIICDEAQDSDSLMLRWLIAHSKSGIKITLMLDDDQTLYSFRNSLGVDICRYFESNLNAKIIHNSVNYRSKIEVLTPAIKLINKNIDRVEKGIISHRGTGGSFDFHHFFSQSSTKKLLNNLITTPSDWFILCRTNSDIDIVASYLTELSIPYSGPEMPPIIERPEIQAFLELLLTLSTNSGHGLELVCTTCIITEHQLIDLLRKTRSESLLIASENGFSKSDLESLTSEQQNKLNDLITKCRIWQISIKEGRTARAIKLVGNWVQNNFSGETSFIETIMSMLISATGAIENRIAYIRMQLEKNREKTDSNSVRLLTAHAAKGLQRKCVIIWSLREGSYPTTPESQLPNHFEEERRVLYVAMTRAEDHLHIIYQENKINSKRITAYSPSRFIHDLEITLIEPKEYIPVKSHALNAAELVTS